MGISLHGSLLENLEEGSYGRGLCEEGSGIGISLFRGPFGEPGEGGPSIGNFEK